MPAGEETMVELEWSFEWSIPVFHNGGECADDREDLSA